MAVQTVYGSRIAPAYEGMIANSEDHTIVSKQVETSPGIGFGKVAVVGTTDDQVRVATAGRPFSGLTCSDHQQGNTGGGAAADVFPQYSTCPVMKKGVLWVLASVAVAVGDPVYFVPATGVLTNVATANTLIPNASWDSSTTGAGLAKVRLG
jgi:hypothetical protein